MRHLAAVAALTAVTALATIASAQDPQPPAGRLQTRWTKDVSQFAPWPEHPRPLLRRANWLSLNGPWDYAIRAADAPMPEQPDGRILVPFPLESALSGVMRPLGPDQRLWYRRTFALPPTPSDRLLLHFGAVDHACEVWVDGTRVGEHRGGFDPFWFDVTSALRGGDEHTLVVAVRDPTDAGPQPRGKQVRQPGGIWYTPCSGIWQPVWLEGVADPFVQDLEVTPERVTGKVRVRAVFAGEPAGWRWSLRVFDRAQVVAEGEAEAGAAIELQVTAPRAWSPRDPFRYGLQVRSCRADDDGAQSGGDWVDSYFAFRDIALVRDAAGHPRIALNGEPLFQFGPLDQGYWPDGIYTPPTFAAMCSDLDVIQRMGCNMLRKHVKVECERYYEECDKRGILVWQDMPSGESQGDPAGFERELRALIAARGRHPSIVTWVVFNEGWGQHDTERYVDLVRQLDPTRLIDNASGWTDRACGDLVDLHVYPGPSMRPPEATRASVLGEFGGLGLPLPGHTWVDRDNWGYVQYADSAALTAAYVQGLARLRPLIAQGLAAAVYTQTTDVEVECNGWLSYDREVAKIDARAAATATRALYARPGRLRTIVAAAREAAGEWRFSTSPPPAGWQQPDFDDTAWNRGPGGFGTAGTPGAVVGTRWDAAEIWLRRHVDIPATPLEEPLWCVHHDEDLEVFVDGEAVLRLSGYTTDYEFVPLTAPARARLQPGRHVFAVHCRQTGGGQFVDLGLSDLVGGR